MNNELLKKIGIYAGIVLLFLGLAYSFVPEVLEGKIVDQHDISGWKGMAHEALEHNKANYGMDQLHVRRNADHCHNRQLRRRLDQEHL